MSSNKIDVTLAKLTDSYHDLQKTPGKFNEIVMTQKRTPHKQAKGTKYYYKMQHDILPIGLPPRPINSGPFKCGNSLGRM